MVQTSAQLADGFFCCRQPGVVQPSFGQWMEVMIRGGLQMTSSAATAASRSARTWSRVQLQPGQSQTSLSITSAVRFRPSDMALKVWLPKSEVSQSCWTVQICGQAQGGYQGFAASVGFSDRAGYQPPCQSFQRRQTTGQSLAWRA
jgi:hypothetical protein